MECAEGVRSQLHAISRSRTEETRLVERARIILVCLEGKEIRQVTRELRVCPFRQ